MTATTPAKDCLAKPTADSTSTFQPLPSRFRPPGARSKKFSANQGREWDNGVFYSLDRR